MIFPNYLLLCEKSSNFATRNEGSAFISILETSSDIITALLDQDTDMKLRDITGALEAFAPLSLQDGFDNAGLQIGLTEDVDTTGVLLCLDVTEAVVDEAIGKGCNVVVSHHPLLFHPCKSITGTDYIQRTIMKAIRGGVAIYSAHTNLDNANGGVNNKMAEKLGLTDTSVLQPKTDDTETGAGLIGTLPSPIDKEDFIQKVKTTFHVDCLRCNRWTGQRVARVALCGGAGAFLIPDAIKAGADVFITGEIGYHRFFGYENDIMLMEIGHYESEQYTREITRQILSTRLPQLRIIDTKTDTNPICYY